MASKPIEMMLEGVEWTEAKCHGPETLDLDMPYQTHEGVFEIAGHKLRCYRLSNGQAVFNAEDFEAFFRALGSENASE